MIALLTGCKKDPARAVPTNAAVSKVKMQVLTSPTSTEPDTIIFTYDSLGRQVMAQTDTLITTYIYTAGSVLMKAGLAGEQFPTTYSLNAQGLAISDSKGSTYSYDANNYLVSMAATLTGGIDSTIYKIYNGNADTTIQFHYDSAYNNKVTTAYTFLSNTDSRNFGLAFLGMANKNLVQSSAITQVINGSTYTLAYSYTYTFDASGRVLQQVQTSGSVSYTMSYTYY